MKTLHFSKYIGAPRPRVWATMVEDATYRKWTAAFCEGSHFKGSWNTGDDIRFLAPNGDGMSSRIAESRLPEFISIKHLGEIVGGVEDTTSERVRAWAPAFENYTLTERDRGTDLEVSLEVSADWETFMLEAWPKALEVLKALCEEGKR
jgi:hypothetical protein